MLYASENALIPAFWKSTKNENMASALSIFIPTYVELLKDRKKHLQFIKSTLDYDTLTNYEVRNIVTINCIVRDTITLDSMSTSEAFTDGIILYDAVYTPDTQEMYVQNINDVKYIEPCINHGMVILNKNIGYTIHNNTTHPEYSKKVIKFLVDLTSDWDKFFVSSNTFTMVFREATLSKDWVYNILGVTVGLPIDTPVEEVISTFRLKLLGVNGERLNSLLNAKYRPEYIAKNYETITDVFSDRLITDKHTYDTTGCLVSHTAGASLVRTQSITTDVFVVNEMVYPGWWKAGSPFEVSPGDWGSTYPIAMYDVTAGNPEVPPYIGYKENNTWFGMPGLPLYTVSYILGNDKEYAISYNSISEENIFVYLVDESGKTVDEIHVEYSATSGEVSCSVDTTGGSTLNLGTQSLQQETMMFFPSAAPAFRVGILLRNAATSSDWGVNVSVSYNYVPTKISEVTPLDSEGMFTITLEDVDERVLDKTLIDDPNFKELVFLNNRKTLIPVNSIELTETYTAISGRKYRLKLTCFGWADPSGNTDTFIQLTDVDTVTVGNIYEIQLMVNSSKSLLNGTEDYNIQVSDLYFNFMKYSITRLYYNKAVFTYSQIVDTLNSLHIDLPLTTVFIITGLEDTDFKNKIKEL